MTQELNLNGLVVFPTFFNLSLNLAIREIDGDTVETVSDFIFWGSKITAGGDCSMKLKDAYSLEEKL